MTLSCLSGGRANALTAGSGTVNVTVVVNPITRTGTLTIAATFANVVYDMGVNLGPVGTVSADTVALSGLDLATGASFVIPFANGSNRFDAAGDIACPSGGCTQPATGPYAFVGFLDRVNVSLLPAGYLYTFDGSVTCTLSGITLTCAGPFVLNAFTSSTVDPGPQQTINQTLSFRDPSAMPRTVNTQVTLTGVMVGGTLSVAGVSRYRGAIPAGYALTSGNFRALFFDVDTSAVFMSGRVCVEVDVNPLDGIVDGTTLTLNQLAILHATTAGNPFAAVPLVFPPGFVCADALTALSPFVLLVDTTPPTTTTTIPGGTTTSTSLPPPTTTSTSVPPATTTSTSTPAPTTTSTSLPGGTTTTTTRPPTTTTQPPAASTTTTIATTPAAPAPSTTTVPPCRTARECLAVATGKPLCIETINATLQKTITKKAGAARTALEKAATAKTSAKAARFLKQARAAINVIVTKAGAFVGKKKGPISAACRDAIRDGLTPVLGAIDAGRF